MKQNTRAPSTPLNRRVGGDFLNIIQKNSVIVLYSQLTREPKPKKIKIIFKFLREMENIRA